MSQHTPGPWVVDPTLTYLVNRGEDGRRIAYIAPNDQVANARLIAAAPDMFEALDNITGLSRALRVGGPDPMDLQGLSDALEEAIHIAAAAMAKAGSEA
ncbi:hypothetical protein E8F20_05950 [Pseudomonas sp. BN415]|uniref:hypothetical protein n=1 Tax=Pseudomonas sp. BN415 TaxID=2567889 RepID=UPI0024579EC2|nr:hypothetical protein [Pseudomonas sp. BN415]MDH4581418.1 hypothetical protein [Pseudomonas sp. BN415]